MGEGENQSEVQYLTCECKECGNYIEFPATSARDTVACPHCCQWTELAVTEEPDVPGVTISLKALLVWIGVPLIVIGGIVFFIYPHPDTKEVRTAPKP